MVTRRSARVWAWASVLLRACAIGLGGLTLLLFAYTTSQRLSYPFALEWMESGSFDMLAALLHQGQLYAPPSLEYIPFNYTPLYYLVSAQVAHLTGEGFLALRLVSLLAACGTMALVLLLVRRTGAGWIAAIAAAVTFAATYALTGTYADTARPDSLFVMLVTAGILALCGWPSGRWSAGVAGLLFGAAYLTKQSALPCLGLLGLFLLLRRRREGLAVAAAGALTVAAGVAWFMASSDGWYRYYTFEIATGYALQPRNILNFASNQLGPLAPAVVAGVAWAAWPARVRTGVHRTLLVALLSVLFGCFWLSLYPGTAANVAIPAAMACSVMLGLGLDALLERARGWAPTDAAKLVALASGAVAIQWLGLLYTPARYVPSANDVAEGRRLIERIAAEPGEAWIPNHGYLDRLAGRPGQAHALALSNAVHGDRRGLARRVLAEQDSAVARGRYSLLILDADSFQARDPIPGYGPPEELFRDRDVFHTRVGVRTRPEVLRRRLPGSPTALPEQASATGGSAHRPR